MRTPGAGFWHRCATAWSKCSVWVFCLIVRALGGSIVTLKKGGVVAKFFKRLFGLLFAVVVIVFAALVGYLVFMQLSYYRLPDNAIAEVRNAASDTMSTNSAYTAVTYNIGFGAYTPDYTFFMDTGIMADGTKTRGEHGKAVSEDVVLANTQGAINTVVLLNPDFILLQEVDTDSDRSYHVNQKAAFETTFVSRTSVYSSNFHSAFLAYPFNDPHGAVQAGMLVLSNKRVESASRRSLPVDEGFPAKFFDLDRCFQVVRIPVEGGRTLVMVNVHMSAYDEGGVYRHQQMQVLGEFLAAERAEGNYVICGGDWNHALSGSVNIYPSQQLIPEWVQVFEDSEVPEGFSLVRPINLEQVASCRGVDIPYQRGVTYMVTVDGFMVSDNVVATAEVVDAGFANSDHNPVQLTFTLE